MTREHGGTVAHDMVLAQVLASIPFATGEPFRAVQLSIGGGSVAGALLTRYSQATVLALESTDQGRRELSDELGPFSDRATVRSVEIPALDWWDLLHGADLVIAVFAVDVLSDAKKRYLYKAVAERISDRGVFLVAGGVRRALLHHLVWLKHAGFPDVDCFWLVDGCGVFGGFKQSRESRPAASAPRPPADN